MSFHWIYTILNALWSVIIPVQELLFIVHRAGNHSHILIINHHKRCYVHCWKKCFAFKTSCYFFSVTQPSVHLVCRMLGGAGLGAGNEGPSSTLLSWCFTQAQEAKFRLCCWSSQPRVRFQSVVKRISLWVSTFLVAIPMEVLSEDEETPSFIIIIIPKWRNSQIQ